jgi:hypothetical protein
MQPLDADDVFHTSSCPVMAGTRSFEHWPFPIFQLVVMGIESVPEDGSITCD